VSGLVTALEPWTDAGRFALVLLRVSGLMIFCPILGSSLLPARLRAVLTLALAIVLVPVVPLTLAVAGSPGFWLVVALRELVVGFGLGLAARVVFDGIEGAARLIAGQSGFALSSMLDPLTGDASVTPALFQNLLTMALVLAADLHHLFFIALVRSYEVLPPAALWPQLAALDQSVAHLGTRLFAVSVQLAGPALVVTLASDLVLVLAGRAMPQVPMFMVAYPVKVAAGIVAMAILAAVTGSALRWIGRTFSSDGAAILAALGAR
jgi:flagellar biosynthetic protein FliR